MLTSLPSPTSQAPIATVWPDFNPMDLLSIFEPAQQITMVPRPEQPALTHYLQQVSAKMAAGFRLTLPPEQASPGMLDHQLRLPEAAGKMVLLTDICQLVQLYADLMDCPQVGLRLEVLTQAMCPKFHVDRTGIRLLCTYTGPGTEWLEDAFCNRAAFIDFSHSGVSLALYNHFYSGSYRKKTRLPARAYNEYPGTIFTRFFI